MAEIPTTNLSETAVTALRHAARLLATGFTGQIKLICNEGGVRNLEVNTSHRTKELEP